ncbi:MAG: LysR family transcriptional regulator [Rhodospirillales bacterium]|nr:LysR family transcriptional regulator [Rhodospirillales bacterium]
MSSDRTEKFVTNLDWNLLRTYVVIVQSGSITAAANKLLLQQPTISLALQRLESSLGNRLIERGRGTFRLTAVGRELFRECTEIYNNISRLDEVASTMAGQITGDIQVSLASHVITPLLDETLSAFHTAYPSVTYKLKIESSANVAQSVLDKSASAGICLVNKRIPKLDYEVVYREFFGFFCGTPHPLFGKTNLQMKDLQGHAAVSFDTDDVADALRPIALLRRQYELEQRIVGHSPHLEEVRRMIQCGLGIGPLPIHVADRDVSDGLLWRLPPYKNPPAIDIYLITNPGKRHNRAEAKFIATLKEEISTKPMNERTYTGHDRP